MENPKITALIFNCEVLRVWSLDDDKLPCYQIQSTDNLNVKLKNFQFIEHFELADCSEIELTPSESKQAFKGVFNEPQMDTQNHTSAVETIQRYQQFVSVPSKMDLLALEFFGKKHMRAIVRPSGTYIQAEVKITPLYCIEKSKPSIQCNKEDQIIQRLFSFHP